MGEHPDFPQESPAIKYLIEQTSKIEDAQACGVGYYKSLSKVLARLDKTDTTLTQLQQSTEKLRKVTDSSVVATIIGQKSDEINETLRKNMEAILVENVKSVSAGIARIEYDNKELNEGFVRLMNEIGETNTKLKNQINTVDSCLVIPSWKAWVYSIGLVVLGVMFGKYI
ncbi:MAG: hypothetical protein PHE17_21030 [Thiothrix sp.]|uniref:hypothetical protein n=1 Tax=Thiothrix sp. TaxID=1032 RepID=UPI002611FB1A|nr:hypothetical protein [Thiothrix sp.]MDD5395515.1 hypothetical protein [Thiothrix sp.]